MSCLFDSLSHFVNGLDASELRKKIVEYLSKDPIFFSDLQEQGKLSVLLGSDRESPSNLENYIHQMSQEQTWGGAIEIRAFCDMFNVRVIVKILANNKDIEFVPGNSNEPPPNNIMIGFTGNHYVPIILK